MNKSQKAQASQKNAKEAAGKKKKLEPKPLEELSEEEAEVKTKGGAKKGAQKPTKKTEESKAPQKKGDKTGDKGQGAKGKTKSNDAKPKRKQSEGEEVKTAKKKGRTARSESKDEEEEEEEEAEPLPVIKPKRPLNALFMYLGDRREALKADGYSFTEISKVATEEYNKLTEAKKKHYLDKYAKNKEIYDKQMAELKEKGVFHLPDGTLSTDPANANFVKIEKPKKKRVTRSLKSPPKSRSVAGRKKKSKLAKKQSS